MGRRIVIVTLNVAQDGFAPRRRYAAIERGLRRLKADVVTLQEVRRYSARRTSADGLLRGYQRVIAGHYASWNQGIWSRFPIARSFRIPYPTAGARWALAAELDVGGARVLVATTHLDYALDAHRERTRQVRALFGGAGRFDGPAIVTGDFNFGDAGPENRAIPEAFTDVWRARRPRQPGFTWDIDKNPMARRGSLPGEPSRRLDRILVRGMRVHDVALAFDRPLRGGLFASDHFAVAAEVAL